MCNYLKFGRLMLIILKDLWNFLMKVWEVEIVYRVYLLKRLIGKDGKILFLVIVCFREILILYFLNLGYFLLYYDE